jgi:hypothetical protein
MSQNYAAKANAAMCVLRYDESKDLADMRRAAITWPRASTTTAR